ncbi:MAG: methionyl-tRNA formyltransferase, partial [Akkermansia sp.]|nr:methionyl-tRNA formyltransferase [Akkermansia sp.]
MGTPEFAVPSLRALLDNGYDVVAAITQPDRPAGRGHKLTPCPVKVLSQERGVAVYQFEKLKKEGVECLKELKPDMFVTAAFGQLLSQEILDIPRYGTVNVHASLLPQYRGSAPINWCILNGETKAGVTTMLTDIGMDTGDMLLKAETEIGE